MGIKFSAKYKGKCDVCRRNATVFTIGDEETKSAAAICQKCVLKGDITDPAEFVRKYGKKDEEPFKPAMRYEKVAAAG